MDWVTLTLMRLLALKVVPDIEADLGKLSFTGLRAFLSSSLLSSYLTYKACLRLDMAWNKPNVLLVHTWYLPSARYMHRCVQEIVPFKVFFTEMVLVAVSTRFSGVSSIFLGYKIAARAFFVTLMGDCWCFFLYFAITVTASVVGHWSWTLTESWEKEFAAVIKWQSQK